MTIPKIRQLPSGAWFCQLRLDGRSISITDDDPDVVTAKAYAYKAGVLKAKKNPDITVGTALQRYIDSRRNVISPATLRGYNMIMKHRFAELQKRAISTLTKPIVQKDVNAESVLCSAKTLKNAYRLIASAISEAGGERFDVKLAQIPVHNKKYLTPEQIPVFCEAIKGSSVEIAGLLALWSCRRSEILGLMWDDVDMEKRTIKICRSVVVGDDGQIVEKNTMKNRSSARTIPMVDQLHDALAAVEDRTGHVVKLYPESIYAAVNRICRKAGLPEVGVHGLRHSFASLAYSLGIPAKTAMQMGGWSNDAVMMGIYTHISSSDVAASELQMTSFFNRGGALDANENANETSGTA